MMTTTTMISISVKPALSAPARAHSRLIVGRKLVGEIPVADVGVDALAARLAVGAEREEVIRLAVRTGIDILIFVPPRILAHAVEVAAVLPVLDARIGRLLNERPEADDDHDHHDFDEGEAARARAARRSATLVSDVAHARDVRAAEPPMRPGRALHHNK